MTEATLSAKVTADIVDFARKMDELKGSVDRAATASQASLATLANEGGGALQRLREKLAMPEAKMLASTAATTATAVEGSFFAITKSVAAATERIEQVSQRTGIASATLEGWVPMLNRTGTSVEIFADAYRALSKDITDAQAGNAKAIEKFQRMGLSIEQLGDTSAVLTALAERLAGIDDPAQRAQLAIDQLGRGGLALLPALRSGGQGFSDSSQQAQAWGMVLDQLTREKLLAFDDSLDDVGTALGGLKTQVAVAIQPSLQIIADAVLGMIGWFNKLDQGIKQIVSVFVVAFAAGGPIVAAAAGVAAAVGVAIAPIAIGGAIITALIAAVTLIIANWQKIKDAGAAIWTSVKTTITGVWDEITTKVDAAVARLNAILDSIKAKTEAVKGFFKDLYTAVVGRSYIPDMVDEIEAEMSRLESSAMVDPTARAVEQTAAQAKAFEVNTTSSVRNATTQTAKILEGAAFTWSDAFSQVATTAVNTWGSITQTVGTSLAKMTDEHVQWGEIVKQIGLQVMGALVTQFIQIAAQWAISQFTMTATQQANDAERVASASAATSTMAGLWAGLTAMMTAAWTVMTTALTALWTGFVIAAKTLLLGLAHGVVAVVGLVVGAIVVVIQGVAVVIQFALHAVANMIFAAAAAVQSIPIVGQILGAILFAAGAVVEGIAVAVPGILAGLAVSLTAGVAALAGAIPALASGGIVTGPTLALIGEAGPEAVVPLRGRNAAFGGGEQTIIVQLDGRALARAMSDHMPSVWRIQGLPA